MATAPAPLQALLFPGLGEVVALARNAEATRNQVVGSKELPLASLITGSAPAPDRLHLCFLVPRTDVGGGARILFEHANRLHARGHRVTVLAHQDPPGWFPLRPEFRQVPLGRDLADEIPPADLIVCGYWDQVLAARATSIAPVVHFEQGDFHLFEQLPPELERWVRTNMAAADATLTINHRVARILDERYGVAASVVPNAIDPDVFRPRGPSSGIDGPYLLVVGWDGNEFKGMAEVSAVWARLQRLRPELRLVWVTPRPPLKPLGQVVIAPPQPQLAALYRDASVYLGASRYETFPLPPLEAMACATPVVTTDNVGVLEYARDGENALVVPIGDVDAMVEGVVRVLDDASLAERLVAGGAATASGYTWSGIVDALEVHHRTTVTSPLSPNDAAWTPVKCPPEPVDDQAAARLEHVLRRTRAREVAVPVIRPGIEGHDVVSWETVVRRSRGGKGAVRVYAPHRHPDAPHHLAHLDALAMLTAGRADLALNRLRAVYRSTDSPAVQGAVAKWIGLALIELDRDGEAADYLATGMKLFPDNADYVYLATLAALINGRSADVHQAGALLRALGPATRYADWFADPVTLLEQRLTPTA